ncbi:hypothetical protein MJO29_001732 [Puccinia striiformis f. sp. tritici]|nr:hypothetical protein MJO29_001732 [Puccinia striiformis f. sp. tritici]
MPSAGDQGNVKSEFSTNVCLPHGSDSNFGLLSIHTLRIRSNQLILVLQIRQSVQALKFCPSRRIVNRRSLPVWFLPTGFTRVGQPRPVNRVLSISVGSSPIVTNHYAPAPEICQAPVVKSRVENLRVLMRGELARQVAERFALTLKNQRPSRLWWSQLGPRYRLAEGTQAF